MYFLEKIKIKIKLWNHTVYHTKASVRLF